MLLLDICRIELLVMHLDDSFLSTYVFLRSQLLFNSVLIGHPLELLKDAAIIF